MCYGGGSRKISGNCWLENQLIYELQVLRETVFLRIRQGAIEKKLDIELTPHTHTCMHM